MFNGANLHFYYELLLFLFNPLLFGLRTLKSTRFGELTNAFIPCNSFLGFYERIINEIGKWLKPLIDLVGISKGAGLNLHLWKCDHVKCRASGTTISKSVNSDANFIIRRTFFSEISANYFQNFH